MKRKWGKIDPKNSMVIREYVGTAEATNDNGAQYNLELSFVLFKRCPLVECKETRKTFILPWEDILDMAEEAGILRTCGTPIPVHQDVEDKLYLTEIINDLYRNGFMHGGKAQVMLRDWARGLRDKTRRHFPASRLRRVHAEIVGKELW